MLDSTTHEQLSKLKLNGFISELQEQEKIAEYKEMSFHDRLSLLIQKEFLDRETKNMVRKISNAKLKHKASLEKVKIESSRGVDKSLIQTLNSTEWIRKKLNILVTGPSGVGKSFLVSAIAEKVCRLGFSARYYRSHNLLSELCASVTDGTFKNYLNQINKFHVIIIDDWALSKITEAEQKYLFELTEARNETSSTVFVSQTPVNLWHSLMPNGAIADAIMDRIVHTALRVELKGESIRKEIDTKLDEGGKKGT
jgi:DNA replication protein DnaC